VSPSGRFIESRPVSGLADDSAGVQHDVGAVTGRTQADWARRLSMTPLSSAPIRMARPET
jgi:hypothetical protein